MITDDLARLTALLDETVARAESRPPSEPQLSEEIGTSRGRLRTLLRRLEEDGAIWPHVGKGKRSAMRERGNGGSFIKSEAFAGLNGLRLIVRSGAIDARATAQELFVEVPRAVLSERARSRDTVASPMPQPRGDEHDMGLSIVPVSTIRETDHPFSGIAESAFTEALNKYLEAAPKSLSEKDQFRYVNLKTWKLVQGDPCLQTGQIAAKVRQNAEKHDYHIDYTDDVLGKIDGRSASGTYGAFKAFLIKQGLGC